MMRSGLVAVLGALGALLAACNGGASSPPTEVEVTLSEFSIAASVTGFSKGAPYRFVLKNAGQAAHEWMIVPRGGEHHGALMVVDASRLPSGGLHTLDYGFRERGAFEFACHLPGHYEAGMRLAVTVQ